MTELDKPKRSLLCLVFSYQAHGFFTAAGMVMLVMAITLGLFTSPLFLYILSPLAIMLGFVGGVLSVLEPPNNQTD